MMGIGGAAEPPELDVMDDITLDFDVGASQGDRKIKVTASVKDVAGRIDTIYYVFDDTGSPNVLTSWTADGNKLAQTGYIPLPASCTPGSVHKLSVWVQNDKLASSEERIVYVYYPLSPTDPPHEAVKYNVTYVLGIDGVSNTVVQQTEAVPFYLESPSQTKPGSSFAGWKLEGTETIYPAGAEFTMPSAPVTFTAQWSVAPEIITTSLDSGSVGTAYLRTVAATGDRPLTWTLSSGSLPVGLNLTQNTEGNAVISGTPTASGTYNFTLKAANSGGFDTQFYTLVINAAPSKFDLTVNSHNGTNNTSVTLSYEANTQVSISTSPSHDGMIFEKWVIDSGAGNLADQTSTATTFTTGNLPTTVTAQYRNPVLTVTNGSVTTPPWGGSAGSYPAGTVVSIAAGRASAGQAFKEWVIDVGGGVFASQSSETTAFTTTLADTTIRATYHNVYPLSVTDGTITDGTGGGAYPSGTVVPIAANPHPDAEYEFDKWERVTGAGAFNDVNSAVTTFTTGGASTEIRATYKIKKYALTVQSGTGSGSYSKGQGASITANPAPAGMTFDKWVISSGRGTLADEYSQTTTFIMDSIPATVTATYKNLYVLTVQSGSGGGSYPAGTAVNITADPPAEEYEFDKWEIVSGAGSFSDASAPATQFTTGGEVTEIKAAYRRKVYGLTVQSGSGGGSYGKGDSVTIVADTPPVNMAFSHWEILSGNGVISNKYSAATTFTMSGGPAVIVARYADLPSYPVIILRPDSDDRIENVDESTAESLLRK